MGFPARAPSWLRYVRFWKRDVESEIDAELRFHFDARIEELISHGQSASDARAQAIAEFGSVADTREALRTIDERIAVRHARGEVLDGWRQDAVYGIRSLFRTPAVTATIIVTLALGLGLNAATYSFLDQVFGRMPRGVVQPQTIQRLWWVHRFGEANVPTFWPHFDYGAYRAVAAAVGQRASTAIYAPPRQLRIGRGENAPGAMVAYAGVGFFDMLGVGPAVGRWFDDDENRLGANISVAVVSDAFSRLALNPDSSAVGQSITINNQRYAVVGVARPEFNGVDLDATDIWLPLGDFAARRTGNEPWWQSHDVNGFEMLLKTANGTGDSEIETLATSALRTYYGSISGRWREQLDSVNVARVGSVIAARGPGLQEKEVEVATRLAGVAVIVLLIACANVSNLLLARAARRRREIAVRLALGISRARLIRLLVIESTILALIAAVAAVAAAQWGGSILRNLLLPDIHWATGSVNLHVALLALAISLLAGTLAGLIPALQASRPSLSRDLKSGAQDGGLHGSALRSSLVVVQAALTVMLLAGAVLFVKSIENVHDLDIGFASDRLVFAAISFDSRDTVRDAAIKPEIDALASRIRHIPGAEEVALAANQPMNAFSFVEWFTDKTFPDGKAPATTFSAVSPEYFAATGLRMLYGAGFPQAHGAATPRVVVINSAMAGAIWPGESPIGRCMRFEKQDAPCYTIIGVAANASRDRVVQSPMPQYYLPLDNMPMPGWSRNPTLVVRAAPDRIGAVMGELRSELHAAWPTGIAKVTRMSDALEPQYRPWRLGATLFSAFGLVALIIAAVGIFSTVSYAVSQRTHEFGVRIALGARIGDVLRLVIGDGLRTVTLGVAIGIVLALAAGRAIESLLYGIKPSNPVVILLVAAILLTVATLAALAPAWRASRVDPMTALRTE